MSGEMSPTGKHTGPPPEVRASHADRDRVVDVLRIAAGDGLLTPDELDERLEAALSARTLGELAPLTADLPAQSGERGPGAKDLVRIEQIHSSPVERVGRWVVPRRMELAVTYCKVTLDFTDAVITHDTLSIELAGAGKTLTLITRPGVVVDTDGLQLVHCKLKHRTDPADSETPVVLRVALSGQKAHGRIVVRPARRTFGQWLLRRPAI